MSCLIGIDVGTGSARAGVFDGTGALLASASAPIRTWHPRSDFAQQSTADIWSAIAGSVKQAVMQAGVGARDISGLGFDATCSMVVVGQKSEPLSVDPKGAEGQDIIVWMDHRAIDDAEHINRVGGAPLKHVGGCISPEMQMPKLRWLKRNMPRVFAAAHSFWDLPDWLVHRATGSNARSVCSVVCKWTYLSHRGLGGEGWDDGFLRAIGLEELADDGHALLGTEFLAPGQRAGGLSERAAAEFGLLPGTPVGASLIDAYAGALGTLAAGGGAPAGRLAVIAGTSACHIGLTEEPAFVPGVWGPYLGALVAGLWANEGGQSAAGALIDAVLDRHAAAADLRREAAAGSSTIFALLEEHLAAMAEETATLTARRHVLPDFHGNRSPLAEPWRLGGITGLSLETGSDDLALDYLATIQSLGYGTRHILEVMRQAGMAVDMLVVSGGLARNRLFVREMADICDCPVIVPETDEPVLLGAAMLGAVASGRFPDTNAAMVALACEGSATEPRGGEIAAYHDRKYAVHRRMQQDFAAIEDIMKGTHR